MTNEERDLIQNFIARVGGAPAGNFSSLPAVQSNLPPIDREADGHIAELFNRYPEARYRITQLAFVQEHALAEMQNQLARAQADLQAARQQVQQLQQQSAPAASPWGAAASPQPQMPPQPQSSRGFLGGLFGGSQQAAPPPPQYQQPAYAPPPQYAPQYAPPPQYAPGYQPGMFQRSGSGFLGSALTTAAGVAGGMVAGNALMNLFSGSHSAGYGGGSGGGFGSGTGFTPQPTTYVPVSQPDTSSASPWASAPDGYEVGGLSKDSTATSGGGWQQAASDGGWQDAPASDGGGWEDAGGGGSDDP